MRKTLCEAFAVLFLLFVGAALAFVFGGRAAHAAPSATGSSAQLSAALTPGWECIPTTAGQPVMSGGTGPAPSCGSGTTAVLAPTYVSSGVGAKPTVEFSAINVQILSGSGSTNGTVNGLGNLVVGYAENTTGRVRTGSNNLIVGSENGWTSYGAIVGGSANQATGKYASLFGANNVASGGSSFATGEHNMASGPYSSVTGGSHNTASGTAASVLGGTGNAASASCQAIPAAHGTC